MKRTLAIAFLVIGTLPLGLVIQQPASASPSSQALLACRADGATISTAIAAFESQNPGVIPTEAALLSSARGGPYLNGWANNPRFYRFTIVKGVLEVQAGRVGSKPTRYVGMVSCSIAGVGLPSHWASPSSQALLACQADGATITTAIAAFESQNPGVIPTEAALLSSARGGPYLNGWANNPRFYRFTIVKGVLEVQAGRVGSKPTRYVGMEACRKIGLN